MSADEKTKELARRELALHDRITDIEVSREEGRAEGVNSVIEKMRKSGFSEEEIQAILNR